MSQQRDVAHREGSEAYCDRWAVFVGTMLAYFRFISHMHLILCVTRVAVFILIYIVLWSFPHFYSHIIERIVNGSDINDRVRRWQSFAKGIRKLCYTALAKGALCLVAGAYITQNSWETAPFTFGIILFIMGIFVLLDMYVVLSYINAIVVKEDLYSATNGFLIEETARISSIPVAALIWSLTVFTVSTISYFGQSGAAQLDLEPSPDMMSARAFGDHSQSSSLDRDHDSLQASAFIAAHSFPVLAKVGVGLMVTFCAVQFIALLRSVTRQRSVASVASDLEAAASTPNSDDASASVVSLQDLSTS